MTPQAADVFLVQERLSWIEADVMNEFHAHADNDSLTEYVMYTKVPTAKELFIVQREPDATGILVERPRALGVREVMIPEIGAEHAL